MLPNYPNSPEVSAEIRVGKLFLWEKKYHSTKSRIIVIMNAICFKGTASSEKEVFFVFITSLKNCKTIRLLPTNSGHD